MEQLQGHRCVRTASVFFRLILVVLTVLAWVLAAWVAGHESSDPVILGRYSLGYTALVLLALAVAAVLTVAHVETLYQRLFRIRVNVALVVLSVAGSLVLGEVAVRALDPAGISYYEESRRYHLDKIADDELVFRHAVHLDTAYQGVRVQTNELGFRDRPVGVKPQDEYRILVLGDSVTFGWGVAAEDTYPRLVEDTLATRLQRPVRTINTAVGGFNTEQELAMAERHWDVLQPDLILLLYVPNDVESLDRPFNPRDEVKLSGKSPPEIARLMLWNSWTYRLARHAWSYSEATPDQATKVDDRGWKTSMASMARLGALARARDVPFFVFLSRYEATPLTDRLRAELTVLAGRHGFFLVDTAPWFVGRDRGVYTRSVVDAHPNPMGHRILADGVAAALLASSALPGGRTEVDRGLVNSRPPGRAP